MTNQQVPEAPAFCWATELAMTQQPVTLSVTEAREVSAGMQRLHAENTTLQQGYAAARLEIESLRARSVAPAGEYPALPEPDRVMEDWSIGGVLVDYFTTDQMRAYADATCAMRAAQPAGAQQPGTAYAALSDAEIDRIVPALEPVSEDFPAEWAVWKDRERIRKELRASHGQAPAQAAPAAVAGPSGDETQKLPGIVDKALNELAGFVKFLETVNGSWNSRTARDALRDIEWFARRKLAAAPTNQPEPQQEPSYTAVQLAELVLSDCGHSSNYTPLLDRVAARIDSHVERRLDELRRCLESKPAPQQEAQEPCPTCTSLARTVMLDQVSFDRKPDCYGIRQITDDEGVEEWEDIRTSPDVAREEANDMMATGRGEIYEVVPLYTTPQPVQVQAHAGMVPLTKEQRNRIVLTVNTVSEAIDMVERHHGIKGGRHGADI